MIRHDRLERLGHIPATTESPELVARWLAQANPGGSPKWWAEVFAQLSKEIGAAPDSPSS